VRLGEFHKNKKTVPANKEATTMALSRLISKSEMKETLQPKYHLGQQSREEKKQHHYVVLSIQKGTGEKKERAVNLK